MLNLRFRMEPQRAAASPGEGPLLASASPLVRALRKLQPETEHTAKLAWKLHLILNFES